MPILKEYNKKFFDRSTNFKLTSTKNSWFSKKDSQNHHSS